MARWVEEVDHRPLSETQVEALIARTLAPLHREGKGSVYPLRDRMKEVMWRKAGLVRNGKQLESALEDLAEIREDLHKVSCPGGPRYNLAWADTLNMENYLDVSEAIVHGALAREESRGSHFRSDFPEQDDEHFRCNLVLSRRDHTPAKHPVVFSRVSPDAA